MPTRVEVYEAVDTEREYQQLRWGTDGIDNGQHPVGSYLTLLDTYLRQAQDAWSTNVGNEPALNAIRKVAGIAVACMEQNGAPLRNLENVVPAGA
jgi:hypothetical protein